MQFSAGSGKHAPTVLQTRNNSLRQRARGREVGEGRLFLPLTMVGVAGGDNRLLRGGN